MKIRFEPTGDPDFIDFIQRGYVVQVFLDDEAVSALTFRDKPGGGYEIWQRGGEDRLKITGDVITSSDGSMTSWDTKVSTADGYLVLAYVNVEIYDPAQPGTLLYRMATFNSYQGRGGVELPLPYVVGIEENLLRLVYNFFAVLASKNLKRSLNLHIEKLNVTAGDHCLSSEEVPRDEMWVVTSVCTKNSCAGVDQVRVSRNYLNNIFTIKQQQSPGANELVCQQGMWVLYGGDFIQSCFTNVPEGCDLHLYITGTQRDPVENMELLGLTIGWPAPLGIGLPWMSFIHYFTSDLRYTISGTLTRVNSTGTCTTPATYLGTLYLVQGSTDIGSVTFENGDPNPVSFKFSGLAPGTYTLKNPTASVLEDDCTGSGSIDVTVGPSQTGLAVKYVRAI